MRKVLSISLPHDLDNKIKSNTKKKGFDSVSSYIKYLISVDDDLISEEELLKEVELSEKEYEKGKAIKAKSMADLYDKK
ncbi:MAG TPA: CopG family transcriptional regulator [Candidatus Pacearchaeota archaeon]|nr:CopG family transcriptional regulator [Candidatus Parcubacteria bacterium]HNP79472.1 CopG family transcriptional regulator [Candidatus Pacearchaeota archaeon]